MKTEKTITICGKEVKLLYCAATENGYEQLAGQSINDLDFRKQSDLLKRTYDHRCLAVRP